jgi:hypothetical protein
MTTDDFGEALAALRRVRTVDGAIEWNRPISPDKETSTPVILANGGVDLFAYGKGYIDSVFTFDATSGTSTSTTFGLSLYYSGLDLAVGADASLYVTHEDNVGGANTTTYVSRISPEGEVVWTTVDLATLGPPAYEGDEIDPSTIALAQNDLVVLIVGKLVQTSHGVDDVSIASAFDPATGSRNWSTVVPGELVGGPVVRSDGTIVAIVSLSYPGGTNLVTLDPADGTPTTHALSTGAFEIFGITEEGVILAGADSGNGLTGLLAIDGSGTVLWSNPDQWGVTIASDGTVIAAGSALMGLDATTGHIKWTLPLPVPGHYVEAAALTSDGTIIALGTDGTLFGASD